MVNIVTKQGKKWYILDAYDVSSLKYNLINVGQLTQKGYRLIFKDEKCSIFDIPSCKRLIYPIFQMTKNGIYPLVMNRGVHDAPFSQSATCFDWS